jgi:hypothetical protein
MYCFVKWGHSYQLFSAIFPVKCTVEDVCFRQKTIDSESPQVSGANCSLFVYLNASVLYGILLFHVKKIVFFYIFSILGPKKRVVVGICAVKKTFVLLSLHKLKGVIASE